MAECLLLTGAVLPARSYLSSGFVSQVVPDHDLESATDGVVAQLASKSPISLARMKQLIRDGLDQSLATAVRNELLAAQTHRSSSDRTEGLAAFNEKRPPRFGCH
jgi:enoyl-CoA hydratase/carnithine racemase